MPITIFGASPESERGARRSKRAKCRSTPSPILAERHIPGTASLGYRDIKHLTELGSLYLWPFLREFFEEHVLPRMAAERALASSG